MYYYFWLLVKFELILSLSADHEHHDSAEFCKFQCNLFHGSLCEIFKSLCSVMEILEVVHFGDRHFWHVIYRLGPYIGDYPEQVLLACIVSGWCAK